MCKRTTAESKKGKGECKVHCNDRSAVGHHVGQAEEAVTRTPKERVVKTRENHLPRRSNSLSRDPADPPPREGTRGINTLTTSSSLTLTPKQWLSLAKPSWKPGAWSPCRSGIESTEHSGEAGRVNLDPGNPHQQENFIFPIWAPSCRQMQPKMEFFPSFLPTFPSPPPHSLSVSHWPAEKNGPQGKECIIWLGCFSYRHCVPAQTETRRSKALDQLGLFSPSPGHQTGGRGSTSEREMSGSTTDDISTFYSSFIIKKECV